MPRYSLNEPEASSPLDGACAAALRGALALLEAMSRVDPTTSKFKIRKPESGFNSRRVIWISPSKIRRLSGAREVLPDSENGCRGPAPFARRLSSAVADNIAKQFGMSMPLWSAGLSNAELVCTGVPDQPR